jgi:hypothetical protein
VRKGVGVPAIKNGEVLGGTRKGGGENLGYAMLISRKVSVVN